LVKQIANLKSKATVIFTTHRPSHMLLANRVAVIDDGQIVLNGAPEKVLEKLNAAA
jgi:ATP-binding cassette, subfamily C, bacterial LapB